MCWNGILESNAASSNDIGCSNSFPPDPAKGTGTRPLPGIGALNHIPPLLAPARLSPPRGVTGTSGTVILGGRYDLGLLIEVSDG